MWLSVGTVRGSQIVSRCMFRFHWQSFDIIVQFYFHRYKPKESFDKDNSFKACVAISQLSVKKSVETSDTNELVKCQIITLFVHTNQNDFINSWPFRKQIKKRLLL